MGNLISDWIENNKRQSALLEAKLSHLRQLKLRQLEWIANEYGILPDEATLQTNPRNAFGMAIANSLNVETIKQAVSEIK